MTSTETALAEIKAALEECLSWFHPHADPRPGTSPTHTREGISRALALLSVLSLGPATPEPTSEDRDRFDRELVDGMARERMSSAATPPAAKADDLEIVALAAAVAAVTEYKIGLGLAPERWSWIEEIRVAVVASLTALDIPRREAEAAERIAVLEKRLKTAHGNSVHGSMTDFPYALRHATADLIGSIIQHTRSAYSDGRSQPAAKAQGGQQP